MQRSSAAARPVHCAPYVREASGTRTNSSLSVKMHLMIFRPPLCVRQRLQLDRSSSISLPRPRPLAHALLAPIAVSAEGEAPAARADNIVVETLDVAQTASDWTPPRRCAAAIRAHVVFATIASFAWPIFLAAEVAPPAIGAGALVTVGSAMLPAVKRLAMVASVTWTTLAFSCRDVAHAVVVTSLGFT